MLTPAAAQALVRNAARRGAYAALAVAELSGEIAAIAQTISDRLGAGGKLLVFGNGGSAACAQHFAAEFTGKLASDRVPFPAISLTVDTSAMTAIANDYGYEHVFSRQVRALATSADVVVGISTSGTSKNVAVAIAAGRDKGAFTIALTGSRNELAADASLSVPLRETARVQEAHDLILHELAQLSERHLVPEIDDDASADRFPFILTEAELEAYRAWLRSSGQTLSTTNGVFDLLHAGHRASLSAARATGDQLCVLVNSDESVRRIKGESRPVRPLADRLADLSHVVAVDHVVVMDDDDPRRLLSHLAPDVHAKGADYRGLDLLEASTVEAAGGEVRYLELLDGYSTTAQITSAGESRR
ncbi:SIS domain-containing protein [Microbacterium ureisolvens]|uniref:SIS domain-containing protein n=1 Tax=Microbacterium ureisolvens TaxID=2781186 RepID=UPI0027E295B5|nr:SIS domain-containing protein [Microbacterium ureisolvens]